MTAHVTVMVRGKPHVISTYQKSKNVWIAAGRYLDEQIHVTRFELHCGDQALARGGRTFATGPEKKERSGAVKPSDNDT